MDYDNEVKVKNMNGVIIHEGNRAIIEVMLNKAQRNARVRTISYGDLAIICNTIEERLGVPKKALEGCVYSVDLHAQNFPHAYKGVPESTEVTVKYLYNKWRLVSATRYKVRGPSGAFMCECMPETLKDALVKKAMCFGRWNRCPRTASTWRCSTRT